MRNDVQSKSDSDDKESDCVEQTSERSQTGEDISCTPIKLFEDAKIQQ